MTARLPPARSPLTRLVHAGVGAVALLIGVVGIFVPGLPTTIFMLVAAYCFGRSVPAWEERLMASRWLGAGLRRFRETGGMTRNAKRGALASMWVSAGLSALFLARTGIVIPAVIVALAVIGTIVVGFRIPTVVAAADPGTHERRVAGRLPPRTP